jgi:hypothetical protein
MILNISHPGQKRSKIILPRRCFLIDNEDYIDLVSEMEYLWERSIEEVRGPA